MGYYRQIDFRCYDHPATPKAESEGLIQRKLVHVFVVEVSE